MKRHMVGASGLTIEETESRKIIEAETEETDEEIEEQVDLFFYWIQFDWFSVSVLVLLKFDKSETRTKRTLIVKRAGLSRLTMIDEVAGWDGIGFNWQTIDDKIRNQKKMEKGGFDQLMKRQTNYQSESEDCFKKLWKTFVKRRTPALKKDFKQVSTCQEEDSCFKKIKS